MLNYMRAELFRSFNRLYFWIFTGVISLLSIGLNILMKTTHTPNMGLTSIMVITLYVLSIPVYLVIAFVDMIAAEENKNLTIRNVVAFGLPRTKIMLCKIATIIILAFTSALIILFVFYGSGTALFGLGSDLPKAIGLVLARLGVAVPLWIGAISIGVFLSTIISNNTLFAFTYVGVFLVPGNAIKLLSMLVSKNFMKLYDFLIPSQLGKLSENNLPSHDLTFAVMLGLIYSIIFITLSILSFNKKEIK